MNYSFQYNSPVMGKNQSFEYLNKATNEYAFSYDRDIFSDLDKFNAPIFVGRRNRGMFFGNNNLFLSKKEYETEIDNIRKTIIRDKKRYGINNGYMIESNYKNTEIYHTIKETLNIRKPMSIRDDGKIIVQSRNGFEIMKTMLTKLHGNKLNMYYGYLMESHVNELNVNGIILGTPFILNTNIYDNYYLRQNSVNTLNIFNNQALKDLHTNALNIYTITPVKENRVNTINVFDYYWLKGDINNISLYRGIMLFNTDKILSIYKDYMLDEKDVNTLSIYNIYWLQEKRVNRTTIHKNYSTQKPDNILVLNKGYLSDKVSKNIKIQQGFFASEKDMIASVYNNIFSEKTINKLYIADNIFLERPISSLYKNKGFSLYKPIEKLYIDCNSKTFNTKKDLTYYNKILGSYINSNKTVINKIQSFIVSSRQTFINEGFLVYKSQSYLWKFKQNFVDKLKEYTFKFKPMFAKKDSVKAKVHKDIFGIKNEKSVLKNAYISHAYIKSENAQRYNEIQIHKNKHITDINIEDITFHKDRYITNVNIENIMVYKKKYNANINITDRTMNRDKLGLNISNSIEVNKDNYGIYINTYADMIYKNKVKMSIEKQKLLMEIIPVDFEIHNNTIGFIVPTRDIYIEENIALLKNANNASIGDTEEFISKEKHKINCNMHSIFVLSEQKKIFLQHYHSIMTTLKFKLCIKDMSDEFVSKWHHDTMLYDNMFVEKINRHIFLCNYLFLQNNAKNTKIFDTQISATKDRLKTWYDNNIHISKKIKTSIIEKDNIFVDKKTIDTSYYTSVFVDKIMSNAFISDNIFIRKNIQKAFLYKNLFVDKNIHEVFMYDNDIYIDKATQMGSTYKNVSFTKKDKDAMYLSMTDMTRDSIRETDFDNNEEFLSKRKEMTVKDNSLSISKNKEIRTEDTDLSISKIKTMNIEEENLFISKEQYEIHPYIQEIQHMHKLMKELEKSVEKTYNWAYVYQYDDPIAPNYAYYGLDELLLPEKDVDYSSFEELIFDKETMTPRNPVKILEDNSFIAKYPIKHPTPDYEKIGIEYIDVPSELMYSIFMRFYQIWYANIFKFGNMSMIDSLKIMLDYIYSYIVTTYSGTEYLKPALRVFRLIRWFGETSIMHNAQYRISYEYEDIKSNLHTGECNIKNELSGFYVDKNLKVLSSEQTGNVAETYIKLYTSNKIDTQMTFSISFNSGTVEVYVNDVLEKVITSNDPLVECELPATDTENEIVLKRTSNYGYCYVGNIIVKNGGFKNLNIEYDPELKAGNMPLSDVVNKMVMLANMYEDENEAFEHFRKGNLGVSELFKRLQEYWELHHANKVKGKRLTIKET